MAGPDSYVLPIVYDMMTAKLAQNLGFPSLLMGGSAVSSGMYGMGDYGMATVSELIEAGSRLAAAVDVPVIVDADDGGGNPMNVYRAFQRYARAGVGSVLIEDLTGAKHVPGRPEGPIVSVEEMSDKVRAAVEAAGPDGPVVLARSDGLSKGEAFDKVLARAKAYSDAGAQLIFVSGAKPEQHLQVANETGKPVLTTAGPRADFNLLFKNKVKFAAVSMESFALQAVHQAMVPLRAAKPVPESLPDLPREISRVLTDADHWADVSKRFNAQSY